MLPKYRHRCNSTCGLVLYMDLERTIVPHGSMTPWSLLFWNIVLNDRRKLGKLAVDLCSHLATNQRFE